MRWRLTERSGALFGSLAGDDAQEFAVARREDTVRVTAGGPHDVVARQRDVDDGAQRLRVTNGGSVACGFCNRSTGAGTFAAHGCLGRGRPPLVLGRQHTDKGGQEQDAKCYVDVGDAVDG